MSVLAQLDDFTYLITWKLNSNFFFFTYKLKQRGSCTNLDINLKFIVNFSFSLLRIEQSMCFVGLKGILGAFCVYIKFSSSYLSDSYRS